MGLDRVHLRLSTIRVDWQLYEDAGHFYRLQPKDDSRRTIDPPPFLAGLLSWMVRQPPEQCCQYTGGPPVEGGGEFPCGGGQPYLWLGGGRIRKLDHLSEPFRAGRLNVISHSSPKMARGSIRMISG